MFKFITKVFSLYETSNRKMSYDKMNGEDFPIHTILLPTFEKSAIIEQLIESIESLDYPRSELEVEFLIESNNQEMLTAIEKHTLPQYFEVMKVPLFLPKIKARLYNYAMSLVRGKYVVMYDVDDKLDPLQLKKTLIEFDRDNDELSCVQARLNYYNHNHNFLTKSFSLKYMSCFRTYCLDSKK
ncbi:glycosyltransferase [Wolbachia endosymbiont of Brugia malayi]|uniref:glycosyltransferase n=2 Tax=Wolbachia endosymbiont of Brugia malayi TaxID=80849 RepID=UPI001CDD6CFC|nr:glycosyltransferase [Wolbachia endosymbiont of Brugia malayi]